MFYEGECGELGRNLPSLKTSAADDAPYDQEKIMTHYITPGKMYSNSKILRNGKMMLSDAPVYYIDIFDTFS